MLLFNLFYLTDTVICCKCTVALTREKKKIILIVDKDFLLKKRNKYMFATRGEF